MSHRKNNREGHSADRPPETPTLRTLFDWFEREVLQHRSRQAQQAFRATFRQALLRFGHQATPTASQVRGWLAERIGRERLAPATANALRAHLHAVYTRARDERWPLLSNAAAFPRFQVLPRGLESRKPSEDSSRVLSAHRPQSATLPYAGVLRRRKGGLADEFLSLLRAAGLRLGEAMGVTQATPKGRRLDRQRGGLK